MRAIRGSGAVQRTLGTGDDYGVVTALSARLIHETVGAQTDLEVSTLFEDGFVKVIDTDKDFEGCILESLSLQCRARVKWSCGRTMIRSRPADLG
jgi:hypothetical protein